ncbi:hypothetical protein Tco_0325313, partial [Tanacetum coccineum]
ETQKPLVKDEEAADVFQVTPKTSYLNAVKRIFRYLKGKPKLGLWYLRVSSFDLDAYSDSDYAQILTGNPQQEVVNFLAEETYFLAMQKADNCGNFYYRLLWASSMDSKSNVRLWVQFHEHKDLH